MDKRTVGLLPGIDTASNVTGRCDSGILRSLHRHGRAFAERAVEQDTFAGGARKLVQHASGANVFPQVRVGGMQRTVDDAVPFTLGALTQIDKSDIGVAGEGRRLSG